ncbi:uncharacterized protein LOC141629396 [Silene latifolia]|uniref:uncharacterized protein LOC141629396 n=1 Tax=Silene latifolia TaxID=37657 RepID=UPI003D780788
MLNKVFQIEDHHGLVCTEGASIQAAFPNYYQEHLGTQTDTEWVNQAVVSRGTCCSEEDYAILAKPVTADQLKQSIFSIPKDKAPGPDGYNSQFYGDAWDVVGDEICAAIMNFFSTGQLLAQVNTIVVTLIPKVDRLTSVKHFRPISCCNVLYKAILKIICTRLALILPDLINWSQGAFVKGRSILENILICQDLVRGDVRSIMLILRAISTFSAASGLKVNDDKSEVVFNGVSNWLRTDITHISGFQEGSLPFKYLGVPVQPGRLTQHDCNILIEKIVHKIRGIGARKMSYAGSDEVYHRTPLVAWDKVCCPKQEGGLGIYAAEVWNIAIIGKLVNWIYTKADRLWVMWIDHVYLKVSDWTDYQPSLDFNWNWRNVCKVRDVLAGGFQDNQWAGWGVETHAHIFSECVFSSHILIAVEQWLQLKLTATSELFKAIAENLQNGAVNLLVKSILKQLVQLTVSSKDRLWLKLYSSCS